MCECTKKGFLSYLTILLIILISIGSNSVHLMKSGVHVQEDVLWSVIVLLCESERCKLLSSREIWHRKLCQMMLLITKGMTLQRHLLFASQIHPIALAPTFLCFLRGRFGSIHSVPARNIDIESKWTVSHTTEAKSNIYMRGGSYFFQGHKVFKMKHHCLSKSPELY